MSPLHLKQSDVQRLITWQLFKLACTLSVLLLLFAKGA